MLPFCIKALYHFPFLNLRRIRALGLTIQQALISDLMVMVANSGMKHKSETMLEVICGLLLEFILYIVTE